MTAPRLPRRSLDLSVNGPRLGRQSCSGDRCGPAADRVGVARLRITPLRAQHWFLLGVGLTQCGRSRRGVVGWCSYSAGAATLAEYGRRLRRTCSFFSSSDPRRARTLLWAIQQGLLGYGDADRRQGSSAQSLRGTRTVPPATPTATVLSVPLLVYRLIMLAWALWIARHCSAGCAGPGDCFSAGGYWRPLRRTPAPHSKSDGSAARSGAFESRHHERQHHES